MSKGPSETVTRIVLEGPATGDKTVPAFYVRRWWWLFTTKWWSAAWVLHSYVANREAKLKRKVTDLYVQLLKTYDEAKEAEKDVARATRSAQEGDRRGVSPVVLQKLGPKEEYVSYDKELWDRTESILKVLKGGVLNLSKRRGGERSAYYTPGALNAFKMTDKGSDPLDPLNVKHHITFRPPDEGKGKGGSKGDNRQNKDNTPQGVQLVTIRPSDNENKD